MGKAKGNPERDFGLEPRGDKFGFARAFAIYFDDVELFGVSVPDGFDGDGKEEVKPAGFGAFNATKVDQIEGYAKGRVGIMGVVGAGAEFFFDEVEHGGFADGAGDGYDAGRPAFEGMISKKSKIRSCYEVELFL